MGCQTIISKELLLVNKELFKAVIGFSKRAVEFSMEEGLFYTVSLAKSNKAVFVDPYMAVISCLNEYCDLLKSFIGSSKKPLKFFYYVQNEFWSDYKEKEGFYNLKEKLSYEINKSRTVDSMFDLLGKRYKVKGETDETINLSISVDLFVPVVDFLIEFISKLKDNSALSFHLYKLEDCVDKFINEFQERDIIFHNINSLFKLLIQREAIHDIFKYNKLSTSFDPISFEDLKIRLLFFYLKHENFIKQLEVSSHLNSYSKKKLSNDLKKHITKTFILNGIIEILLGPHCNEELVNNVDEFFIFIAPELNYESLLILFKIKLTANKSKLDQINRILSILVKHINPNVD